MPPSGWQPDPSWPDPPAGWPFWLEDRMPTAPAGGFALSVDSRWTIGGGLAVFLGSLLPFISSSAFDPVTVHGGARATSALYGLVLAGLGAALQFMPATATTPAARSRAYGFGITLLVLSALGLLGYLGFTLVGAAGIQQSDGFGLSEKVTFSPSIGIILAIFGSAAVLTGAIRILRHVPATR
jgi:hypothetical protein